MIRRTVLALAVSAAACAPGAHSDEEVNEAAQAESLTDPSRENAIRFLEQATFGPRLSPAAPHAIDTVEFVDASGITAAIDAQLAAPAGVFASSTTSPDLGAQFFGAAIDGSDQLRLRVAFALSQIIVVSELGIPNNVSSPQNEPKIALAGYFNKVRAGAFGSFRALLETITRDPAMGQYLSMVNNRAFDSNGLPLEPNENFARELLQLFTLGLDKLYDDGTQQLDCTGDGLADTGCTMTAGGMPIPAYTEAQVQAFAAAFSGWTFAKTTTGTAATECPTRGGKNGSFYGIEAACTTANECGTPMIACDVNHDSSSQTLLRGGKTTAGGTAETHLTQALDNIAKDSNVPPFVVKQLIQHLVTSNPSPAYVKRVVNVWKNSTYPTAGGVRGDLAAVVRAILVDAEARGPAAPLAQYASYGHLRSPALFISSMVRWMDGHLDTSSGKIPGTKLNTASGAMGQSVPRAPSVFSYYPPGATVPGDSGLLGPEFAIASTATIAARTNFVHDLLFGSLNASAGIVTNVDVLPNDPNDMVVWLEQNMLHNAGSSDLELKIFSALNDPRATAGATTTATQNRNKKKLAVTLAALSPEFQIQR